MRRVEMTILGEKLVSGARNTLRRVAPQALAVDVDMCSKK